MESETSEENEVITVYVCTNVDCKSYYGCSSMTHLENEPNFRINTREVTYYRNKCPNCGSRRIRRYAVIIPLEEQRRIEREQTSRFETKVEA